MNSLSIAIVDGTGPFKDSEYVKEMKHSFCSQLGQIEGKVQYERGPSGEGFRIRERAKRAVQFLLNQKASRIMLAGYSRGGSIAVIAAEMLKEKGINVDFLFLFDPVDRHLSGDTKVIPSNVCEVWVARRKIDAKAMNKYDRMLPFYKAGHNPARNWFGTTATETESNDTVVNAETFLGSHGALGGVGWGEVKEDPACQVAVAEFMNRGLKSAGLSFKLISVAPKTVEKSNTIGTWIRKLMH